MPFINCQFIELDKVMNGNLAETEGGSSKIIDAHKGGKGLWGGEVGKSLTPSGNFLNHKNVIKSKI